MWVLPHFSWRQAAKADRLGSRGWRCREPTRPETGYSPAGAPCGRQACKAANVGFQAKCGRTHILDGFLTLRVFDAEFTRIANLSEPDTGGGIQDDRADLIGTIAKRRHVMDGQGRKTTCSNVELSADSLPQS